MSPAASRPLVEGSGSEVLRLARFLRSFPDTTRGFEDLYQWAKHAEALSTFLPTCSASCLQDLVWSSDLHELLCSSLAHALHLLVAATNAQPVLEKQDMQCFMVLISLLLNINVLSNSCQTPVNGVWSVVSELNQQMRATMELTSECISNDRGRPENDTMLTAVSVEQQSQPKNGMPGSVAVRSPGFACMYHAFNATEWLCVGRIYAFERCAGLPNELAAACPVLATQFTQHMQQQQQQRRQQRQQEVWNRIFANLTGHVLGLIATAQCWALEARQDSVMQHPQWRCTILPAGELLAAVLMPWPEQLGSVAADTANASSRRRAAAATASSTSRLMDSPYRQASTKGARLATDMFYAAVAGNVHSSGPVATLAAFSELANASPAGAAALLRALYVTAAWAAEAEHKRQQGVSPAISVQVPVTKRGSSSSSKRRSSRYQQLKVPSYHMQYLNACGVTWQSKCPQVPPAACIQLVALMHQQAMETCATHSSQPAALLALQQQQQQQHQQQQSADSFAVWRQLQVSQVLPGPEQLLLLLESTAFQPDILANAAVILWNSTLAALDKHSCTTAAAEILLQPALNLLGPAVMHCSNEASKMFLLLLEYIETIWRLVIAASGGVLLAAVKQQPLVSLQSLEFAVRSSSTTLSTAFLSLDPQHGVTWAPNCLVIDISAAEFITSTGWPVSQQLAERVMHLCQQLLKDTEVKQTAPIPEVFALTVSCLKLVHLGTAIRLGMVTYQGIEGSSSSSTESSDGSSSSSSTDISAAQVCLHQALSALNSLETGARMICYDKLCSNSSNSSSHTGCNGLMLVARSLCLLAEACTLLGGQVPASYAAGGGRNGAQEQMPASHNATAAAVAAGEGGRRDLAAAVAEGGRDAQGSAAAAAAMAAAAAVSRPVVASGNDLQIMCDILCRLEKAIGMSSKASLPGLQLLVRAAGLKGQQQQQQLSRDLQGLQILIPAVSAAIKHSSETPEEAANSAAAAADSSAMMSSSGKLNSSSSSAAPTAAAGLLLELGTRLVACGEAISALCPVPLCCNNPGCVELRGASELQLVADKGTLCSRCRVARYCSKACQQVHWKAHRRICKGLSSSCSSSR